VAFLTDKVFDYMKKTHNFGRTVAIKMKTLEFPISTRSRSFNSEVRKLGELRKVVFTLLEENIADAGHVRFQPGTRAGSGWRTVVDQISGRGRVRGGAAKDKD